MSKENDDKKPPVEPKETKTHSEEAFRKVSDDMHKFKGMVKELSVTIEQMRLAKEDSEREQLEKNEQYKELYESELSKSQDLQAKLEERNNNFINSQKLSAVKDKLGQFKKSEYNKFIDTSRIIIDNDGNVDLSTVENEVNRLKQEYPELIKVKVASELPNQSPESGSINAKPIQKMTSQERSDIRRQLIEKRHEQQ